MLDEAAKHIREAIMLGRTDILKKLLEEVKVSFKGSLVVFSANFHICYSSCLLQTSKTDVSNTTIFSTNVTPTLALFSTKPSKWVVFFVFISAAKLNDFYCIIKTEKRDVVRALLMEGSDPGVLDEGQDTAVDLIGSVEMRQVFADVLIQSAASGG